MDVEGIDYNEDLETQDSDLGMIIVSQIFKYIANDKVIECERKYGRLIKQKGFFLNDKFHVLLLSFDKIPFK